MTCLEPVVRNNDMILSILKTWYYRRKLYMFRAIKAYNHLLQMFSQSLYRCNKYLGRDLRSYGAIRLDSDKSSPGAWRRRAFEWCILNLRRTLYK